MPVTTGRKAIRFKNHKAMQQAIIMDAAYQYRHLVIRYLHPDGVFAKAAASRKEISERMHIPVNAISKVVSSLISEGILKEEGNRACEITGRNSRVVYFNREYNGPL